MIKIVIHSEYGGFYIDDKMKGIMCELGYTGDFTEYALWVYGIERANCYLVEAVEMLIKKSVYNKYDGLEIDQVDDDDKWFIIEHDGYEELCI